MTETIDRATNHMDSTDWMYDEGIPGKGARPEYLSEKYKSIADQAKSYKELEKRLGAQGSAPEKYELDDLRNDIDIENDHIGGFIKYAKEQRLSQEVVSKSLKSLAEYNKSKIPDFNKELEKLGPDGGKKYEVAQQWAKNTLSAESLRALDEMPKTANTIKMLDEMRQLHYKNSSKLPVDGAESKFVPLSRADVENEMINNYKRYQDDPRYRAEIAQKFAQALG